MVSDRVDIKTPQNLGQDAEWLILTKVSGSIFSQELQDSQTEKYEKLMAFLFFEQVNNFVLYSTKSF